MASDLQDLFTALRMFGDGVSQLQQSRVIRSANEAVQKIRTEETNQAEQRAQLQQVANQLTAQLAASGTPATTIQALTQAFGPTQVRSADQAILEGQLRGSTGEGEFLTQAGRKAQDIQREDELRMIEQRGLIQERLMDRKLAAMAAKQTKPLSDDTIRKLTDVEADLLKGHDLLKKVEANPDLLNRAKNISPGLRALAESATSEAGRIFGVDVAPPEFGPFKADIGQWFDAYRQRITGAGATDAERAQLERNRPSIQDDPATFRQKIVNVLTIGERYRARLVTNFAKGKRDVSDFMHPVTPYGEGVFEAVSKRDISATDKARSGSYAGSEPLPASDEMVAASMSSASPADLDKELSKAAYARQAQEINAAGGKAAYIKGLQEGTIKESQSPAEAKLQRARSMSTAKDNFKVVTMRNRSTGQLQKFRVYGDGRRVPISN